MHVMNYLDDWLVLAQSEHMLCLQVDSSNAISQQFLHILRWWLIRTNSYDLTQMILYDFSKPQ